MKRRIISLLLLAVLCLSMALTVYAAPSGDLSDVAPFNFGKSLLIALVVGVIVGIVVALILKGQLKSVHKQNQANVYIKPGSMALTVRNDFFLYRTVNRRKRENNSGGSERS